MYRLFYPAAPVQNSIALTSVASMSVAGLSNTRGILKRIAVQTTTASVTGTPSAELRIVIDGLSTITIPCWVTSNAFDLALRPFLGQVATLSNPGGGIGDTAVLTFMSEFRSSLVVDFYVTGAGTNGGARVSVEYETYRN